MHLIHASKCIRILFKMSNYLFNEKESHVVLPAFCFWSSCFRTLEMFPNFELWTMPYNFFSDPDIWKVPVANGKRRVLFVDVKKKDCCSVCAHFERLQGKLMNNKAQFRDGCQNLNNWCITSVIVLLFRSVSLAVPVPGTST